jgi:hypothetical protein
MKASLTKYGYCHMTIHSYAARKILRSNSERAFIITQFQDLLSPRLLLGDIPAHRQLASCIDLLAFSITPQAIHLVAFTIDYTIAKDFAHRLALRLAQYQSECAPNSLGHVADTQVSFEYLSGPHHALTRSLSLHLLHEDWEYDRYSSIGFYLHDRRGDWMRVWRLTSLYESEPELYYELMKNYRQVANNGSGDSFPIQFVPLLAS